MTGLKSLYDLGKVAVIQGCGYPDYNLSHEESRGSGRPAIRRAPTSTGAGGSAAISRPRASATPARTSRRVAIQNRVPGELANGSISVLSIQDVLEFDFPSMGTRSGTSPARRPPTRRSTTTPWRPGSRR